MFRILFNHNVCWKISVKAKGPFPSDLFGFLRILIRNTGSFCILVKVVKKSRPEMKL